MRFRFLCLALYWFAAALGECQTVTLTGDFVGSGNTVINTTLSPSGVTAGTYGDATHVPIIQYDAKGRAISASNVLLNFIPFGASIPSTQITGLGAAASHGTTITINSVACSLDSSCTVAGGGGGSGESAITGLRFGNNTGADTVATPVQIRSALATSEATVITGGVGTGANAGIVPATPGAGNPSFVVCFNATTGAAILDANNLAQWCILKSDGSQTVIAGPPPPLTYAAIHAALLAADSNCGVSGADSSQWLTTGHCTIPPGLPPSWVSAAYFNVGPDTNGTLSGTTGTVSYTVQHAGDAVVVTTQTDQNSTGAPTSIVSSKGQAGTLIASAYDSSATGYRATSFIIQNLTAGAQTFVVTYPTSGASARGYVIIEADEFQSVPTTGTAFEAATTSINGNACGAVATTGANEEVVTWVTDGTQRPGNNGWTSSTGLSALSQSSTLLWGDTLSAASTITPSWNRAPKVCLSFALKHN